MNMTVIKTIVDFLKGKKSYILAGLGVLTVLANHYSYISSSTEQQILLILGFGTVAALRAGIAKLVQG